MKMSQYATDNYIIQLLMSYHMKDIEIIEMRYKDNNKMLITFEFPIYESETLAKIFRRELNLNPRQFDKAKEFFKSLKQQYRENGNKVIKGD